jgi:hypothetical protein
MSRRLKGILSAMAVQQESALVAAVLERERDRVKRQREHGLIVGFILRGVIEAECRLAEGGQLGRRTQRSHRVLGVGG